MQTNVTNTTKMYGGGQNYQVPYSLNFRPTWKRPSNLRTRTQNGRTSAGKNSRRTSSSSFQVKRKSTTTRPVVQNITVMHPGTPTINAAPTTQSADLVQQQLIRDTYKQCLAQQAQSGKYLTSLQRQSLRTAIMTEAGVQQQPGPQGSPSPGLPNSNSPSMTTEELAYLLRLKASITGSKSSPNPLVS